MTKVLLAEDDYDFGSLLKQYLEIHNFEVSWAKDGEEAFVLLEEFVPAICVFDVMMPKMDGFSLAEKVVEKYPDIPFLFLTARKQKEDKIKGLKLGANDYIEKPFDADILVLKLQNILKVKSVSSAITGSNESGLPIGKYNFDVKRNQLQSAQRTHQLTEKESLVLQYLCTHQNMLIKREEILSKIWHNKDYFSGRSMDVFISRLRKYFADDNAIRIETIRGVGLEFRVDI